MIFWLIGGGFLKCFYLLGSELLLGDIGILTLEDINMLVVVLLTRLFT